MKLIRTKEDGLEENYLELHYDILDEETKEYISRMDSTLAYIEGICDDMRITVPVSDVMYIETVDRRTFAYTADKCIEMRDSLRTVLGSFSDAGLIRISKSVLVNIYKIDHLQGDMNMRVIIFLKNGEKLVMNRAYRSEFFDRVERINKK